MAAPLAPSPFGWHVPLVLPAGPEGAPGTPDGVKVLGLSSPAADIPAENRHALHTTGVDVADCTALSGTCRMFIIAWERSQRAQDGPVLSIVARRAYYAV